MKVTVFFNSHRSLGADMGVLKIDSKDGYEEKSFQMSSWKAFRVGAGRGARANQADYQAFVKFLDDQGPLQYRETFKDAQSWREKIERWHY